MVHAALNAVGKAGRGIAVAIRARWKVFAAVALGVFVLYLFLPVLVLSIARKPVEHFTINPCVAGCGVPVLPVLGLAFTGLPTDTLKLVKEASRVATAVVLLAMTLGVAYFSWLVSGSAKETRPT